MYYRLTARRVLSLLGNATLLTSLHSTVPFYDLQVIAQNVLDSDSCSDRMARDGVVTGD
jgi:hypothetical protein